MDLASAACTDLKNQGGPMGFLVWYNQCKVARLEGLLVFNLSIIVPGAYD